MDLVYLIGALFVVWILINCIVFAVMYGIAIYQEGKRIKSRDYTNCKYFVGDKPSRYCKCLYRSTDAYVYTAAELQDCIPGSNAGCWER